MAQSNLKAPGHIKQMMKRHSKSELIDMMFAQDLQYSKNVTILTAALAELGGSLKVEASLFQDELPDIEYIIEEGSVTARIMEDES